MSTIVNILPRIQEKRDQEHGERTVLDPEFVKASLRDDTEVDRAIFKLEVLLTEYKRERGMI